MGSATTIEEALLCIVPPLEKAGKLPTNLGTTQIFEDTAKGISTYIKGGRSIWPSHFSNGFWIWQKHQ